MAKVKCRYCKKKIDKEGAYSPFARKYYCSVEEYNKSMEDIDYLHKIKLLLNDLLENSSINTFINKRISELAQNYSYKQIYETIDEMSLEIQFGINSNNFNNENHKINYTFAIIRNSINDVIEKNKIIVPVPKETIPVEQPVFANVYKYKPRKKKEMIKDISFSE